MQVVRLGRAGSRTDRCGPCRSRRWCRRRTTCWPGCLECPCTGTAASRGRRGALGCAGDLQRASEEGGEGFSEPACAWTSSKREPAPVSSKISVPRTKEPLTIGPSMPAQTTDRPVLVDRHFWIGVVDLGGVKDVTASGRRGGRFSPTASLSALGPRELAGRGQRGGRQVPRTKLPYSV